MKVDMLDVLDVYQAAKITSHLKGLYELFIVDNLGDLNGYIIHCLLEQHGYELECSTFTIDFNDKNKISFCVNGYDTAVSIDSDCNVVVSEIIDSSEYHVTIATYNGRGYKVEYIDID